MSTRTSRAKKQREENGRVEEAHRPKICRKIRERLPVSRFAAQPAKQKMSEKRGEGGGHYNTDIESIADTLLESNSEGTPSPSLCYFPTTERLIVIVSRTDGETRCQSPGEVAKVRRKSEVDDGAVCHRSFQCVAFLVAFGS